MTEIRTARWDEEASERGRDDLNAGERPIVERYTAAKAAAAAVVQAPRTADHRATDAGRALLLAALVALLDSVGDVPVLLRAVRAAGLRAANLAAAGRAAVLAERDGEADPLYYVRDELEHGQGNATDTADRGSVEL